MKMYDILIYFIILLIKILIIVQFRGYFKTENIIITNNVFISVIIKFYEDEIGI